MSLLCQNAHDWEYLSEGGAHIILHCSSASCSYYGLVIKIPKCTINNAQKQLSTYSYFLLHGNIEFIRNSIQKWFLGIFLTDSKLVYLEESFLSDIITGIDASRYVGRKKTAASLLPIAYLEQNLLHFERNENNNTLHTLSWEFKVKCGLKSCSPLLHPSCFVKLQYHRYEIIQRVKQVKADICQDTLSWGKFIKTSSYNPRDLCSRNRNRIVQAIKLLLDNPQNNLGIRYNGQHIYGWEKNDYQAILRVFVASCETLMDPAVVDHTDKDEYSSLCRGLYENLLSSIITTSDILHRLEVLQALDFLDAEGMELVYEHGIKHMNHSLSAFEQFLQSYLQSYILNEDVIYCLGCMLLMVANESVDDVLNTIAISHNIRALLHLRITEHTTFEERKRKQSYAKEIIASCTMEEIGEILYLHMLSMIAKDASLIITLCPIITTKNHNNDDDDDASLPNITLSLNEFRVAAAAVESSQIFPVQLPDLDDVQQSDLGYVFPWGHDKGIAFQFRMKLIDIGLKPIQKLHMKYQKEKDYCALFDEHHE